MKALTQTRLLELIAYDPVSGDFSWRLPRGSAPQGTVAGSVQAQGPRKYRRIRIDGTSYAAHRLAVLYVTGSMPPHQVDHKDGNGLNNAYENLRLATQAENLRNRRLSKNNTSGINGVTWSRSENAWCCSIGANNRTVKLGQYKSFFEACAARKSAEFKLGYFPNHGAPRPQEGSKP